MGSIGGYAKGEHPVIVKFSGLIGKWNDRCDLEWYFLPLHRKIMVAIGWNMVRYGMKIQDRFWRGYR